jgi:hypothetical protein
MLAEGEAVGGINFDGQTPSWRNAENPADVNDNGEVTPLDALLVIAYINANLDDLSVPPPPAEPPPYYDVDGNGSVTALDVLIIIDVLNAQAGEPSSGEPSSGTGEGSGGVGEGEYAPASLASVPRRSDKPEAQARDGHRPVTAMPLLATGDLNEPRSHSRSLHVATPPHKAGAVDRSDVWRTAADSYFQQISSAEDERSTVASQPIVAEADLDEILPEIAVEITKLSDAFSALRV